DVARRKDSRRAGFEKIINDHAAVDREARVLGECNTRAHADTDDHEVSIERAASAEGDPLVIDVRGRFAEMEDDAMLLVQRAHEIAHLWAEDALHRPFSR